MMVQIIMMISFVVAGLADAKAEATGLDFPDQKGDKDEVGSGSALSGGPTIIEYPRDQTLHITIGSEEVKLTCQASGSDLIGGYWERLNGDPIPKENNISIIHMDLDNTMMQLNMTIVGARPVHLGLYHCVVYSRWGITESIPTQVNITVAPPMITMQPISRTADVFQNVTFLCEAVGFKVTYDWKHSDSNDIIGNQPNLTIPEITPSDEGYYFCVAVNKGGRVTSDVIALTVNRIFSLHPQRATIATGGNITFSTPAIGVGYTYHWKKKNGSLPNTAIGQNTPHLNILSVNPVDSGIYHCIVEFPSGYKVKSARATLTVYALPVITTHPNSNGPITVAEGSDVLLSCEATGEGTLNYQWRRLSGSLPDNVQGNNATNLTISNITVSDSGEYYCVVNNGGTEVFSMKVQVMAKVKPFIKNCSHNQELSIVNGTEKMVLVWEFGGDDLDGVSCQRENEGTLLSIFKDVQTLTNNNFELTIDNIRPSNSGNYTCTVYSQWGEAQSRKIQVIITIAPPTITKQPTSKTVSVLQDVTFICEADGFRVKYKWKRHGTIRSASTSQSRLTITQIVPSDAGHYVCIVRTEGGKVAFRIATLTVNELTLDPSDLTVGEGSNVLLHCNINSPEVSWHIQKHSGTYTTTDNSPLMDLYNVSKTDSGHYQCTVNISGEQVKSNNATITVFGLVDQLNDTIAPAGSEVELKCSASVSTAVNCTWKHNDTAMNTNCSDHLSLMLHNVSWTDEGSYTCEMIGNAGKPVTSTAKLKILYVDIHPQNYLVVVGLSTNFNCSPSVLSPMMTYQWLHNGTTMINETSAVLTIANVKIADGGTYQCVVMVNYDSVTSNSAQLNTYPQPPEKNFIGTNRNTMLIGGGAVIIVICVFIAACCCWRCRKKSKLAFETSVALQPVSSSPQTENLSLHEGSTAMNLNEESQKWKKALDKHWHWVCKKLYGEVVNEIAAKLKEDLDHLKYIEIIDAKSIEKIRILLSVIRQYQDDTLFNKFCDALIGVKHSNIANILRS
ncbi:basement membrane-specific heparan sulfate proteoglycan core protein-like isoform X2 [Dysidea avara]|uniref:basement membrane-specific heparan sulfate proteoglycan core protein-like isoform X2 n=1 Tax=Dysidea avara TaxID=196820 RepID=UPI003323ADA0